MQWVTEIIKSMPKLDMVKFVALSAALHTAVLAPWDAPIVPTHRAEAVLSVAFTSSVAEKAVTSGAYASPAVVTKKAVVNMENVKRHYIRHESANTSNAETGVAQFVRDAEEQRLAVVGARSLKSSKAGAGKTSGRSRLLAVTRSADPQGQTLAAQAQVTSSAPALAASARKPYSTLAPTHNAARHTDQSPVDATAAELNTAMAAAQTRALVHARLQRDLARYFSYPAIARRRGWQGNVRVGFTVEPDGRLSHLHIAQSSGYEILDNSALKALRKVEQLTEVASVLSGQALAMQVPVIYRLEEY